MQVAKILTTFELEIFMELGKHARKIFKTFMQKKSNLENESLVEKRIVGALPDLCLLRYPFIR